jgi:hypothetical protein
MEKKRMLKGERKRVFVPGYLPKMPANMGCPRVELGETGLGLMGIIIIE